MRKGEEALPGRGGQMMAYLPKIGQGKVAEMIGSVLNVLS